MEKDRKKKRRHLSVVLILAFGGGGIVLLLQNIDIARRGEWNPLHDALLLIVLTIAFGLICRNLVKLWEKLDNVLDQIKEIQRNKSE